MLVMNRDVDFRKIEWLESFTRNKSSDISFDLYKNFADSEESLRKYWNAFSDFYYISCAPFDNSIEQWKNVPEIYEILKRSVHMANGFPLEILIWKYSDESMDKARKITEERRKEFEWTGIMVWDPKEYMYLVGFFGGTSWRTNQYIIKQIRDMFPDKVKMIK
jgi:hypothetical protein